MLYNDGEYYAKSGTPLARFSAYHKDDTIAVRCGLEADTVTFVLNGTVVGPPQTIDHDAYNVAFNADTKGDAVTIINEQHTMHGS